MTLEESQHMPEKVRRLYADDDSMAEAFSKAWSFIALLDERSVTGQRFSTKFLADYLGKNGWETVLANWTRKPTRRYTYPMTSRRVWNTRHGMENTRREDSRFKGINETSYIIADSRALLSPGRQRLRRGYLPLDWSSAARCPRCWSFLDPYPLLG